MNADGRGGLLGEFGPEDKILTVMQSGEYRLLGFGLSTQFEDDMILIEKWNPEKPVSAIYFDSSKKVYMIKRFLAEKSTKPVEFIPEGEDIQLELVTSDWKPRIQITFRKRSGETEALVEEINVADFIGVKGYKAKGNVLTKETVTAIDPLEPIPFEPAVTETVENEIVPETEEETSTQTEEETSAEIELEVDPPVEEKSIIAPEPEKKEETPKPKKSPRGASMLGCSCPSQ